MTLLLNLVPALIGLFYGGMWFLFGSKYKENYIRNRAVIVILLGITLLLYSQVQPSYLPKGEVKRSEVPLFEESDAVVSDRFKRTDTDERYRETKRMHEEFMNGEKK